MRIVFLLGIIFICLNSCDKTDKGNNAAIQITNNTDKKIDLTYLSTVSNEATTEDFKISSSGVLNTKLNFSNVSKSDGAYSIYFRYENSIDTIRKDFGYYTNGYPLDSKFEISIFSDSIIIKGTPLKLGLY